MYLKINIAILFVFWATFATAQYHKVATEDACRDAYANCKGYTKKISRLPTLNKGQLYLETVIKSRLIPLASITNTKQGVLLEVVSEINEWGETTSTKTDKLLHRDDACLLFMATTIAKDANRWTPLLLKNKNKVKSAITFSFYLKESLLTYQVYCTSKYTYRDCEPSIIYQGKIPF